MYILHVIFSYLYICTLFYIGIIVNTCGWIDGPGYDVILHCIQTLSIDVVLVMSHDRLYSSLLSSVAEGVTVVKLAHSGGVVQRVSIC